MSSPVFAARRPAGSPTKNRATFTCIAPRADALDRGRAFASHASTVPNRRTQNAPVQKLDDSDASRSSAARPAEMIGMKCDTPARTATFPRMMPIFQAE